MNLFDILRDSFDLDIVKWFASISNSILDTIFSLITQMGDDIFFILVVAFIYWIVDKKIGYKIAMFFLHGAAFNSVLKTVVNRPRPYMEPGIESIGEKTAASSFPSGHAQNSMMLGLGLDEYFSKGKTWVKVLIYSLVGLVLISRVYLAQHYLTDVLVGALISLGLFFLMNYFYKKETFKINPILISAPILLILMIFVHEKNLYVATAGIIAMAIGFYLEKKHINLDPKKGTILIHTLKFVIGIAVTLIIQQGLKLVFPYSGVEHSTDVMDLIFDFIRYGLVSFWITFGSMATFKFIFKKYYNNN